MRLHAIFSWRILLLFVTIGPPIGALIWLATTPSGIDHSSFVQILADGLIFLAAAVPISWVFGLVPALVAGLLLSVACAFMPTGLAQRKIVVVLLGAALGYVATLTFKWLVFSMQDLDGTLPLEAIGALSASVCSVLVRTAWVIPDSSFKPKTLRGSA